MAEQESATCFLSFPIRPLTIFRVFEMEPDKPFKKEENQKTPQR